MNMSKTSRELGIGRTTLYLYKKNHWDSYLENKGEVAEQVHDVQAVRFNTVKDFNEMKDIFSQALKIALQKSIDILNDPEKLKTMSHANLIQYINVISPYAAEKVGLAATINDSQNMKSTHTTFVQNIIEQLNIEKHKKVKDESK